VILNISNNNPIGKKNLKSLENIIKTSGKKIDLKNFTLKGKNQKSLKDPAPQKMYITIIQKLRSTLTNICDDGMFLDMNTKPRSGSSNKACPSNNTTKICEKWEKMHEMGISHNDVIGSNLMFNENDEVYFIDWGQSSKQDSLQETLNNELGPKPTLPDYSLTPELQSLDKGKANYPMNSHHLNKYCKDSLVGGSNFYNYIINPNTNRKVKTNSNLGKKILNNYLLSL
jgi:serine/threonine protein kinase